VSGTRQVARHGVAHHAQAQKGDFLGRGGFVGFGSNLAHGCLVVKWKKSYFGSLWVFWRSPGALA
jgi:hypothetical protein